VFLLLTNTFASYDNDEKEFSSPPFRPLSKPLPLASRQGLSPLPRVASVLSPVCTFAEACRSLQQRAHLAQKILPVLCTLRLPATHFGLAGVYSDSGSTNSSFRGSMQLSRCEARCTEDMRGTTLFVSQSTVLIH
jgi:hypothetical protein